MTERTSRELPDYLAAMGLLPLPGVRSETKGGHAVTARKPITYHVGCFILEEMHAHDWRVSDLAIRSGISTERLQALILNEESLTHKDAAGLAEAFGTSQLMWKRLGGISQEATP